MGGEGERGGRQVADMATSGSLTKTISKKAPEVLPRASRARRFGIDCESELRWHAKEPGGDYKQKLLIKNVSNQVLCNVCTHVCLCVVLRACVPVACACGACAAHGGATLALFRCPTSWWRNEPPRTWERMLGSLQLDGRSKVPCSFAWSSLGSLDESKAGMVVM